MAQLVQYCTFLLQLCTSVYVHIYAYTCIYTYTQLYICIFRVITRRPQGTLTLYNLSPQTELRQEKRNGSAGHRLRPQGIHIYLSISIHIHISVYICIFRSFYLSIHTHIYTHSIRSQTPNDTETRTRHGSAGHMPRPQGMLSLYDLSEETGRGGAGSEV